MAANLYPVSYARKAGSKGLYLTGKFGIVNYGPSIRIVQDVPKFFVSVSKVHVDVNEAGLKTCREALWIRIAISQVEAHFVSWAQSSIDKGLCQVIGTASEFAPTYYSIAVNECRRVVRDARFYAVK
jgi:hypothetical protein